MSKTPAANPNPDSSKTCPHCGIVANFLGRHLKTCTVTQPCPACHGTGTQPPVTNLPTGRLRERRLDATDDKPQGATEEVSSYVKGKSLKYQAMNEMMDEEEVNNPYKYGVVMLTNNREVAENVADIYSIIENPGEITRWLREVGASLQEKLIKDPMPDRPKEAKHLGCTVCGHKVSHYPTCDFSKPKETKPAITSKPDVMGGEWVIEGTRIPIERLLYLIRQDYPQLTEVKIMAVLNRLSEATALSAAKHSCFCPDCPGYRPMEGE